MIIIIVLALIIAMLCRSLVHTILHHYGEFDKKYQAADYWWQPGISHINKRTIKWTIKIFNWFVWKFNIPVQVSDAFHFFNTVELGCYNLIISILAVLAFGLVWWWGLIIFAGIALIMIIFFNLGYDEIWR